MEKKRRGTMSNVAIVGGSGFIGDALTKKLMLESKYKITILDIKPPKLNVEYLNTDITDIDQLKKNLKNMDIVINLAAIVGVDYCHNNPEIVESINFNSVKKIIEACKVNNIQKFIFSSSSEVYGDLVQQPLDEDCEKKPLSVYAHSKLKAEEYIKNYNADMDFIILRFFNAYGENQRNDFVVNNFIDKALENKPIEIHGDGEQIRCFTYISDIVEGIFKAINCQNQREVDFNIGNNTPISIKELANYIIKITGSKSNIQYVNYGENNVRKEDIKLRIPNINKAKDILNFKPSVSWQEGVKKIVEYKRHVLSFEPPKK